MKAGLKESYCIELQDHEPLMKEFLWLKYDQTSHLYKLFEVFYSKFAPIRFQQTDLGNIYPKFGAQS